MTTSLSLVAADAAATAADPPVLHVVFKVDRADYALPASSVLQLETYTGSTPVPGAPRHVAGILQLRGRVVPAVDLRTLFGLETRAPSLETRVVVGELGTRAVALIADSAREVVRIAPSQERPPPHLVDGGIGGVVRAVAQLGDRTILLLDLGRLIGEELHRVER